MILLHPSTCKLNIKLTTSHIPQNKEGKKKKQDSHLNGLEVKPRWQADTQKFWRIPKIWKAHSTKSTEKKKRLEKARTRFWRRLLEGRTVMEIFQDGRQCEVTFSCNPEHRI